MGQKVNPLAIRLGIIKSSHSIWYAKREQYCQYIIDDMKLREYIESKYAFAGISRVVINRPAQDAQVIIHCARPGVVIGKKGSDIDVLRRRISSIIGFPAHVIVEEVKKPDLDASIVADGIASQLERRILYRKAMKRAVQSAMRAGAMGVKIMVSGRLNGAEIARNEKYHEGRVPLHTFRADIDYGTSRAETTYGIIGIKVWIFKGEVFPSTT